MKHNKMVTQQHNGQPTLAFNDEELDTYPWVRKMLVIPREITGVWDRSAKALAFVIKSAIAGGENLFFAEIPCDAIIIPSRPAVLATVFDKAATKVLSPFERL